ncbi:hypothetical protein AcV5_000374 [Taiwanofungus camphoratus]|nr:hypothetical protein AcV5_000374 [Antrodia cinnamomea]
MATRCSSGSRSQPPALDARFIGLAVESRPAHTIMAYSKYEKPRGFAYGYTHRSTIVPRHLSAVTNTLSEPLTSLSATLRLQSRTQLALLVGEMVVHRSSENHGQMFSNYTFQYCPGLALHPRAHSRLL